MVLIACLAAGLALGYTVASLAIHDVDPETSPRIDAHNKTQFIHYDIDSLRAMGSLTATPSNYTAMAARALGNTHITGDDDRIDWANSSWPYSAMGKLISSNGHTCSATLVGPRHILTARHCTPDSNRDVIFRFAPFYFNGETRYQGSQVQAAISNNQTDGDCYAGQDWAIHILKDRIGEELGWFGARAIDPKWMNRPIFENFGYPFDRHNTSRPVKSSGGTVRGLGGCGDDSPAWADIDVASGQSGGPIWEVNEPYVMGIAHGLGITFAGFGIMWASGQSFVNAIISARNDFP